MFGSKFGRMVAQATRRGYGKGLKSADCTMSRTKIPKLCTAWINTDAMERAEAPQNSTQQRLSLKESLKYCRETVKARSPDMYEHIVLLPAREQTHQFALRAFALELASIPFSATNPALASMRLQWWKSAMERVQNIVHMYHGIPLPQESSSTEQDAAAAYPPNHYAVQVLAHLARDDFATFDFDLIHSILNAHETYVDRKEFDSLPELVSVIDRDHGALMTLLVSLSRPAEHRRGIQPLGPIPNEARKAAVLTSRATGLGYILRAAPYWLRQKHVQLPRDILFDHQLDTRLLKRYQVQLDSGVMSATHIDTLVESAGVQLSQDQSKPTSNTIRTQTVPSQSHSSAHTHSHAHAHADGSTCSHSHHEHEHTEIEPITKEVREVASNLRNTVRLLVDVAEEQLQMGLEATKQARSNEEITKAAACEVILPTIATAKYFEKLKRVNYDIFHPSLASLDARDLFSLRSKTLWSYIKM